MTRLEYGMPRGLSDAGHLVVDGCCVACGKLRDGYSLEIGIDIDDVLYPWYDQAHKACIKAGITNGVTPSTWTPYEEYGVGLEEWIEALREATLDGSLYSQRPYRGARKALSDLRWAGHNLHLITARGHFGVHRDEVRQHTKDWLKNYGIPYSTLTFTLDKTEVDVDFAIDDQVKHYDAYESVGVRAFILQRPWNQPDNDGRRRVRNIRQFADQLLGRQPYV